MLEKLRAVKMSRSEKAVEAEKAENRGSYTQFGSQEFTAQDLFQGLDGPGTFLRRVMLRDFPRVGPDGTQIL